MAGQTQAREQERFGNTKCRWTLSKGGKGMASGELQSP